MAVAEYFAGGGKTDNGMLFNLASEILNENLIIEVERFRVYQFGRDEFLAELFLS